MNRTKNGHRFEGTNVASGPMRGSSKIDPGLVRPKSDPKASNDERKGLADPCYVVCVNAAIIAAQQKRQPKGPPSSAVHQWPSVPTRSNRALQHQQAL
ncbi:hypothetical protein N7467_007396 [Penicillium canescens]|nr:hypothetical protein N7467_007396 [Penicillium canescens]